MCCCLICNSMLGVVVDECSDPRARPDPVGGSEPKARGRPTEAINQIPLAITFHDPGTPV